MASRLLKVYLSKPSVFIRKISKVKELTVDPGRRLSMQRHKKRAEHWFVSEGIATVYGLDVATDLTKVTYQRHKSLHIRKGEWHMLANETDKPLKETATIRISPDNRRVIKHLAFEQGVDMSSLIDKALSQFIKREPKAKKYI